MNTKIKLSEWEMDNFGIDESSVGQAFKAQKQGHFQQDQWLTAYFFFV